MRAGSGSLGLEPSYNDGEVAAVHDEDEESGPKPRGHLPVDVNPGLGRIKKRKILE